MTAIGIRIEFVKQKWPDLLKMARAGQLQMWQLGWITIARATLPRLLYGPNIGLGTSRASSCPSTTGSTTRRELARRARAQRALPPDGRVVAAYNPWELGVYTLENTLVQPWVLGYRKHAYWEHPWLYLDLDPVRRASAR